MPIHAITRREFLRYAALSASSIVLAACSAPAAIAPTLAPISPPSTPVPFAAIGSSPTITPLPAATATLVPPPTATAAKWRVSGYPFPSLAIFDETMAKYMQQRSIPGGALAITRNSKLVLARGYTFSDDLKFTVQPTSLFRLASISKPITSVALMQLVEQKKLDLNATLTSLVKFIPLAGQRLEPRLDKITVLNLLQHLGGWDRDRTFDPMFHDAAIARASNSQLPIGQTQIISYLANQPLDHDPGMKYAYSNFGYMLLGRIIERVAGQAYEEYVQSNIFAPLGIKRASLGRSLSGFRLPDEVPYYSIYTDQTVLDPSGNTVPSPYGSFNLENMDSHGAWVMSAIDLLRFAATFDDPNSSLILSHNSIETIFAAPSNTAIGSGYYGCGWMVRPVYGRGRTTSHNRTLAGTVTLLVRRYDGLNWAVLFNQRDDLSDRTGRTYGEIDGMLDQAADAVKSWHDYDLFGEYQ